MLFRSPWQCQRSRDTTEELNLDVREPERVRQMREILEAHNAEQLAPAWPSRVEMAVNVDKTLLREDELDDQYIYWPN